LLELFCLSLLNCSALCIVDTNPLSGTWLADMSPTLCAASSPCCPSPVHKLFSMASFLRLILLCCLCFEYQIQDQCHRAFPHLFCNNSYGFSSHIEVFSPFGFTLENRVRVQSHSLVCGYLAFPAPFVEETVLSRLHILGALLKTG
jgi:hypothetical protein